MERFINLLGMRLQKVLISAKEEGLYGAGQDLLKDAFSGNVKGWVQAWLKSIWRKGQVKYFVYLLRQDRTWCI